MTVVAPDGQACTGCGHGHLSLAFEKAIQVTRVCLHSHQRPERTSKRRKSKKVARELVVTSGGMTKMFDAIEEAIDDVPSPIQHAGRCHVSGVCSQEE